MNAFIRLLYALLIAAAVVAFVGVTIASFYQPPKFPEPSFTSYKPNASEAEMLKESEENEKRYQEHREKEKAYYRNVAMIVLPLAAIITAVGLFYMRQSEVIGEGVALGGVGTSLYAIITSSLADQDIMRFLAVTLLLASAILLTHKRFIEHAPKKK